MTTCERLLIVRITNIWNGFIYLFLNAIDVNWNTGVYEYVFIDKVFLILNSLLVYLFTYGTKNYTSQT